MALGIYGSWLMLSKLKELFPLAPLVDFVDLEDGLLTVRSNKKLTAKHSAVKLRATFGTILTQVVVESYDDHQDVYRLQPLNSELLLANLESNRREALRLPKSIPVSIAGSKGHSEDISVSGTRVVTEIALAPDSEQEITLEFESPEFPALAVKAQVCWSGKKMDASFQSGLRFSGLTQEQRDLIQRFIEQGLQLENKLHKLADCSKES